MRLGISLPTRQPDNSAPTVTQLMQRAALIERIGFDGIWLGDSVGRANWPVPDTLSWLVAAAAGTQHIELGTSILQVPIRHATELAQRLMTLHALSSGRFRAGLGSGSTLADFEAVGVSYADRFRVLAAALPRVRELCRGNSVGAAHLVPWAGAQAGPPILVGSWHSGLWVRRAAEEYDGWLASGMFTTFAQLREGIQRYRSFGGRRALVSTIRVNLRASSPAPFGEDSPFSLECPANEAKDRLARLAELGYDDALLTRANHTEADLTAEDLEQIRSLLPRT